MNNLTWTCHICGEERDDKFIAVHTAAMKGLPGAFMNIRYCFDRPSCHQGAIKAGKTGNFPKRKTKPKKKWWEFWK